MSPRTSTTCKISAIQQRFSHASPVPLLTRALAMRFLLVVLAATSGLACSTTYPRQLPCDIPHGSFVLCYRQAALHHECEHVSSLFSTGSHPSSYTHYHGVTRREHVHMPACCHDTATIALCVRDATPLLLSVAGASCHVNSALGLASVSAKSLACSDTANLAHTSGVFGLASVLAAPACSDATRSAHTPACSAAVRFAHTPACSDGARLAHTPACSGADVSAHITARSVDTSSTRTSFPFSSLTLRPLPTILTSQDVSLVTGITASRRGRAGPPLPGSDLTLSDQVALLASQASSAVPVSNPVTSVGTTAASSSVLPVVTGIMDLNAGPTAPESAKVKKLKVVHLPNSCLDGLNFTLYIKWWTSVRAQLQIAGLLAAVGGADCATDPATTVHKWKIEEAAGFLFQCIENTDMYLEASAHMQDAFALGKFIFASCAPIERIEEALQKAVQCLDTPTFKHSTIQEWLREIKLNLALCDTFAKASFISTHASFVRTEAGDHCAPVSPSCRWLRHRSLGQGCCTCRC